MINKKTLFAIILVTLCIKTDNFGSEDDHASRSDLGRLGQLCLHGLLLRSSEFDISKALESFEMEKRMPPIPPEEDAWLAWMEENDKEEI